MQAANDIRRRRSSERGVTLPEMLTVLATIGLLVAVAVPALGNFLEAGKVRSSNDMVIADLRAARYIAITKRISNTVSFDVAARAYSYQDIRGNTVLRWLEPGVSLAVTNGPVIFGTGGDISTSPPTIVISGAVGSTFTDQYTISVSASGRTTSVFTRT